MAGCWPPPPPWPRPGRPWPRAGRALAAVRPERGRERESRSLEEVVDHHQVRERNFGKGKKLGEKNRYLSLFLNIYKYLKYHTCHMPLVLISYHSTYSHHSSQVNPSPPSNMRSFLTNTSNKNKFFYI